MLLYSSKPASVALLVGQHMYVSGLGVAWVDEVFCG